MMKKMLFFVICDKSNDANGGVCVGMLTAGWVGTYCSLPGLRTFWKSEKK